MRGSQWSLFTTLLSLQWSNAIQQKHPRALSSRPRGFFPVKNQPHFKAASVSALGLQDFLWTSSTLLTKWEMPKSQQKSIKCYRILGGKKLLCFLTCTANSGSNLSLWLRTCHNNLFLFFRKEQHLALQLWLFGKFASWHATWLKWPGATNSFKMQLSAHNPRPSVAWLSPSQLALKGGKG